MAIGAWLNRGVEEGDYVQADEDVPEIDDDLLAAADTILAGRTHDLERHLGPQLLFKECSFTEPVSVTLSE